MSHQPSHNPPQIGWFCSYVPEEIILAAGGEPVRLEGRVESVRQADTYLHANLCFAVRNIFESGLQNQYDEVDAVIFANSCDGMRRLYELWCHYIQKPKAYYLDIPKNQDENAIAYFTDQLRQLKSQLEKGFGISILDQELVRANLQMNARRKRMLKLFEDQQASPPPLPGSELHALIIRESRLPKADTEAEIQSFLEKRNAARLEGASLPRLLVLGHEGTTPTLFRLIENSRAQTVLFDTCRGLKHYSGITAAEGDPLQAMARRYLLKPSCARMPGSAGRMQRLSGLIDDYAIDGVIYSGIQFCDYALFESALLVPFLKSKGLPVLVLENDYIWSNTEQIRTRIEAFVEMLRQETLGMRRTES